MINDEHRGSPWGRETAQAWCFCLFSRGLNCLLVAFLKSTGCSLSLHAIAVLGLYAWPAPSTDQFTLSGQRDVISLEASLSDDSSSLAFDVQSVAEEQPLVLHYDPISTPPLERQADLTDVTRRDRVRTPREVKLEEPMAPAKLTAHAAAATKRRAVTDVELPDVQIDPIDPIRRLTPASPPPASLPASVPTDQLVGLDDDVAPDFSGNPPPVYPAEAIRQKLEGVVLLRLFVDASGRIEKVEIAKSSGHAMLDNAAAGAVREWNGRPARSASRAVASVEILPIRFRL